MGDITAMTRLAQQDQATTSISRRTPEAPLAGRSLFAASGVMSDRTDLDHLRPLGHVDADPSRQVRDAA